MALAWILSLLGVALITYKCSKVVPKTNNIQHKNVAYTQTYFNVVRPAKTTKLKSDHLVKIKNFKVEKQDNAVGPMAGFYSQGDKLVLGANQFWGKGDTGGFKMYFKKALNRTFINYNSTCVGSSPSRISRGSCFVKFAEGFLVPKLIYRSHAFTCNVTKCNIKANLSLPSSSWEEDLNSSLSKPQLLKLLDPVRFPIPSNPDSNLHKATITIEFPGPGTRHIWFQPLYWNLGGYFRNYSPIDILNDSNQFYANLTYLTRNRNTGLDGFYGLHDPVTSNYYTDTGNIIQVRSDIYFL